LEADGDEIDIDTQEDMKNLIQEKSDALLILNIKLHEQEIEYSENDDESNEGE
jgi:hypothetical protein